MPWLTILIPALAGLMVLALPSRAARRVLLLAGSLGHAASVAVITLSGNLPQGGRWVGVDELGKLFLGITSALFLMVAVYSAGYLGRESGRTIHDVEEGFLFRNEPEAVFVACLLFFLATMSLVCVSRDMGLLWVAVEATTLASAPLISFHRHHRSLEATWKYLLICSVGIALALLGNFFLAYAGHGQVSLNMEDLLVNAAALNPTWLKASFLMLLVGYGTKMGLAPMHTWLPDAHSEAPSMVSALLSGALLNCAFLGILRGHAVLSAAGLERFSGELLIFFGLLSMAVGALFLIRQADYKRMLAYSSIEHMGILALGVGLGGLAARGALLHSLNHSIAKGMLFLVAGNLLFIFGTKKAGEVEGLLKAAPVTGFLWVGGYLAIAGSPPFGTFLSELVILKGALDGGRWAVAGLYLLLLGIVFVSMARVVLPMAFGLPSDKTAAPDSGLGGREPVWFAAPAMVMGVAILALGLYVPPALWQLVDRAAAMVGIP